MEPLTRRRLAQLTAAAMAASACGSNDPEPQAESALEGEAAQGTNYIGPLTDVDESQIAGRVFDPVAYGGDLFAEAPRRLGFEAETRADAEAWQGKLRAKLTELIGGFPEERVELRPQTIETREFPGYTREKLVFQSRPGMSVLAYVLTPKDVQKPAPTMICVPGHGRGVDDCVGIDENGRDRTERVDYQYDFAIQVAEAGMTAVAIEPLGFGCRRDAANMARGLGQSSCRPAAGIALLFGETIIGWRTWDVMRTIDYLETRDDVDAGRIGCMGISGGGMVTTFAAALEPRIKTALVSGYLNTFQASIGSISHCMDNYVPGILNWAEMYDIAGLIAPKPLFVESGEQDNIFPIAASVASFERVKAIYEVFGAGDQVEQEVFPRAHSFWGKQGIPFLARQLEA